MNKVPEAQQLTTSLRAKWLGDNLRRLRKARKIALKTAGGYLQRDGSTIGRYEAGEFPIRRGDLLALLTLYGVSDEHTRDNLLRQCEETWRKGWWDKHVNDLGQDFINVPWLESQATHICAYQNMVISGLLQTRQYAHAIISASAQPNETAEQIQRWVELRLQRQSILTNHEPTKLTHLVEQRVLERKMGSREVRRNQLEHLITINKHDHIRVLVVPNETSFHGGDRGSFTLYEMPESYEDVAVATAQGGTLYVESPEVERIKLAWDDIEKLALSPTDSEELISGLLKGSELDE